MRFELACYDRGASYEDLMKTAFVASRKAFDCVCVPAGLVYKIKDFAVGPQISAAIDFPFGTDIIETRVASIIYAVRRGADFIDLVANNVDLISGGFEKVLDDARICKQVCDDKNVPIRIILEYSLFDAKSLMDICKRLRTVGIDTVVTSSLTLSDDPIDSLIAAELIKRETAMKVIVATQCYTHHIRDLCKSCGVDGIRVGAYKNIYLQTLEDGV